MTRPRPGIIGVVLGLAGMTLLVPRAAAQEVCAGCHQEVASAFTNTDHGRTFAADRVYQSASCSNCHAGAAEHISSGASTKPLNPATAQAADANAVCLSCHEQKPTHASWQGSAHQLAGVRCATCHDVHVPHDGTAVTSDRLPGVGATTETCLQCHGAMRAALNARSTHPLRDGQMDCASCHDPHGTTGEKLLRQASVNDLCYSCHQNTRGPFLWEHAPVREDCATCHRPHGSNYPSLLQARITQLCQSCHQQGRHQTLASLPASVWVANKACVNCHSQIHGSNHPSGPLFQR